ncbi:MULTISPECIES: EF-hand domain-containing protein [Actinomadura]|uniref:Calmodulin n=1 Tax=Actinomadura madurae TaxID=1993 RepID=A0A1I5JZF5_9ACTN|nr:EF-hand domain-containing protein [Actinomadura madurae]MCP9947766.1 EF-hand domain-containing protein [Actinomadura madurae]MCP9964529.1 EF-hand domain-containing protein [Actinomadura madurae]MCP9977010.1 EF-hand domain-containing protein [Actinomadura madurae]MCQ0011487.1 EF-hand domain-containing protein [Actinomadura madurae]MCQ0013203.1 EF-hand domain-containing protein [Actinomadura madurae]
MADVDEYRATFELVDVDGDGYISTDELKNLMTRLGQDVTDTRAVEVVVAADANRDGRISLEEFAELMERTASR